MNKYINYRLTDVAGAAIAEATLQATGGCNDTHVLAAAVIATARVLAGLGLGQGVQGFNGPGVPKFRHAFDRALGLGLLHAQHRLLRAVRPVDLVLEYGQPRWRRYLIRC